MRHGRLRLGFAALGRVLAEVASCACGQCLAHRERGGEAGRESEGSGGESPTHKGRSRSPLFKQNSIDTAA